MNIIDQAKGFVESLRELASRCVWDWRRCPHCGQSMTCKYGTYVRRPWFFEGRREVRVQRHRCHSCRRTYAERSALLIGGSWYAREVHRLAIDQWQHTGTSLRRTAEWIRSWLGCQERWLFWRVLEAGRDKTGHCYLTASTVHRWLDKAGVEAERTVAGQLSGVAISRQMGTDGLWARLRGGVQRVALAVVDCVSGVVWPAVVVEGEEKEEGWGQLFQRAEEAGLNLNALRGVTSDGSHGLQAYLRGSMGWVNHQRCVWHLWRSLAQTLKAQVRAATEGLAEAVVASVSQQVRRELFSLMRAVFNAGSYEQAEVALARLKAHAWGEKLARTMSTNLDAALMHLQPYNRGLSRVAPEYLWRDFRLRLSRGRNHGSSQRLQRALLVWAIYRNFTPAQWRSERKRHYRRPGQSPLSQAGVLLGELSYLDALRV
jgi:transposase-like protein